MKIATLRYDYFSPLRCEWRTLCNRECETEREASEHLEKLIKDFGGTIRGASFDGEAMELPFLLHRE